MMMATALMRVINMMMMALLIVPGFAHLSDDHPLITRWIISAHSFDHWSHHVDEASVNALYL